MKNIFKGKSILITGGTGTIGQEIVRQLLKICEPNVIRIYSRDETKQFLMEEKFGRQKRLRFFLGDIRDAKRLQRAMEKIDIVFHCAALKHVPACEYNPFEAIRTNIIGTQNLIDIAINFEIEKLIFTSSDKAVNPSNVMGASKLMAEKLITSANYYKGNRKTIFSSVRFGNVLGSRGSVIPLFKEQTINGKPITITNPDMTRFIMSIEKAVELIFKATEISHGGEVFVFKMPSIRIMDLAEVIAEEMIEKHKKNFKIEYKYIGIKPGEKPYEELLTDEELSRVVETKDMFIILPQMLEEFQMVHKKYSNRKFAQRKRYTSADVPILSKEEIREMLIKYSLLD